MGTKRVGGAVGPHFLDTPGNYNGARVAAATLVGRVSLTQGNTLLGNLAAGATVGTCASGGSVGQLHQGAPVMVTFTNAADYVDVDMTGPFG